LVNSILWNDSPQEIFFISSSVTVTYSDIQGGWTGEGNIDLYPLFDDPSNGDYHLTENSPCIDAGDPDSQYNDPDSTRNDMGAYYFDQSTNLYAQFSSDIREGEAPLTINFYDNTIIQPVSWEWDFNNDGTIDSQAQNPQWTYYERGYYTVTLTVFDGTYEDTETKEDYISLLNSAPIIQNPLQDFSFDEDTSDSSIDLFSVFDDPDLPYGDSLSFTYSGNDSIFVAILNGAVTLTPLPDWFGSENITFTAWDDSLLSISDDVLVTVINVNDPPEINFPANFTFYEDSLETYDFTQYITDIDNSLNELSLT